MKKCLIVNLVGAPGVGKSTGAAYIFSQLKLRGINCELVTEYAKRKVWEENKKALENQAYIFGKQYYAISSCIDQLDVIVTDSPLFLSMYYNSSELLGESFNKVVLDVFNSFNNKTYLLRRVKEYNPKGRTQSEAESDTMHTEIMELLNKNKIQYMLKDGNIDGYTEIIEEVLTEFNKVPNKTSNKLPNKNQELRELTISNMEFAEFLCTRNTIQIRDEEEFDAFIKKIEEDESVLSQFSTFLNPEARTYKYWRKMVKINSRGHFDLVFEFDAYKGLTFYTNRQDSIDWYQREPFIFR